jgi:glycosyltransferase involved in cell wall biosynthesis
MRLLFVVQRYGAEVAGGAEQHCRRFATLMAERGHEVEVLTSAALSYVDWADHYPVGTDNSETVVVHRLGVRRPRDNRLFGPLNARVVTRPGSVPLFLQREWMQAQGPDLPGLVPWLERHAPSYDIVIFFTYLYQTTCAGLPVASRLAPSILHPTAHEERPLHLPLFDLVFRHPRAFACSTEEEVELLRRRFRARQPAAVVGVGVDLEVAPLGREEATFRSAWGLGDRPYLLYLGRLDPHKGVDELYHFFVTWRRRHPGSDLALVMAGDPVRPLPFHPDVVVTGVVDEESRRGALRGCLAFALHSPFESFSMVLAEAWAAGKPALVQGFSEVLAGQARRGGGAIAFRGYAEWEAAVELLLDDPGLGPALGKAGRAYVERRYHWDVVLSRYERLLEQVAASRPGRPPASRPGPGGWAPPRAG